MKRNLIIDTYRLLEIETTVKYNYFILKRFQIRFLIRLLLVCYAITPIFGKRFRCFFLIEKSMLFGPIYILEENVPFLTV